MQLLLAKDGCCLSSTFCMLPEGVNLSKRAATLAAPCKVFPCTVMSTLGALVTVSRIGVFHIPHSHNCKKVLLFVSSLGLRYQSHVPCILLIPETVIAAVRMFCALVAGSPSSMMSVGLTAGETCKEVKWRFAKRDLKRLTSRSEAGNRSGARSLHFALVVGSTLLDGTASGVQLVLGRPSR